MASEDDTLSSIPRLKQRATSGDSLALELLVACAASPDRKTSTDASRALNDLATAGDSALLRALEGVRGNLGAHPALDTALATLRDKLAVQ